MPTDQKWNPAAELRQRYSGLKNWSDRRILTELSDPAKFRSAFPQYAGLSDATIAKNIGALLSAEKPEQDFSAPANNIEGLFSMYAPSGEMKKVPYSKVMEASSAGFKIDPNDAATYAKDKLWDIKKTNPKATLEDIKIPEVAVTMSQSPKPWTVPWLKEKAYNVAYRGLEALPTAGGVAGGLAAGGLGAESGPADIAIASAGAAAGGGEGEVLRQAGERALFNAPPMTAKESAKEIGEQVASQGAAEATGRVGARLLEPAAQYFSRTAQESRLSGIPLLPSEAHGRAPGYIERFLKGSIITRGTMERFRDLQNTQTQAAVQKIADGISGSRGTTEELGYIIQDGINEHKEEFRALQNKLYGDIDALVNEKATTVPVASKAVPTGLYDAQGQPITRTVMGSKTVVTDDVMPSTAAIKKFAAQELKKLQSAEQLLTPDMLKQSRDMLQSLIDSPDHVTYKAMASARSDALDKARQLDQALAGKEAGLAKKMANLFNDSMMDAAEKSKIPGLPEAIQKANAMTRQEHEMFEQALVKRIVKTKRPEAITSLLRARTTAIQETRDLFDILPKDLHGPVQRQLLLDTMAQATNAQTKIFNERRFAELIGNLGDERGEIIFGNNWENVKGISRILERINGPATLGSGGTGAALSNLSLIKDILAGVAGFALARGSVGAATVAGGLAIAGDFVSYRTMAYAMTHPETAAKLFKALQVVVRGAPYAATGAWNEASAPSLFQLRAEAAQRNPKNSRTQSRTPGVTHVYDPDQGKIVSVQ